MDDRGVVGKRISDEGLKAIATIIVQGIKAGDLNTRSLGTVKSPRFTRLMSELKEATDSASGAPIPPAPAPTPPTPGPVPAPANQAGGQSANQPGKSAQPPKPPVPKKNKVRFIPVGPLVAPPQYPVAIRLHLEELSALDIQKFPNMAFLMLRALVEKSIKAYADAKGADIKGSGNNTNGYVQLHHALKWFGQYVDQNGPKPLIQPVTQLRSGKLINYTASNDALNAINHNHHFHVDPDEVINCWNSIDSILRELMKP